MKPLSPILTTSFTAVLVTVATLVAVEFFQPETARAEPEDGAIRIAIVDLEYVARNSPAYEQIKTKWSVVQEEVEERELRLKREQSSIHSKLKRAELEDRGEFEILALRVELRSIEEAIAAAEPDHEEYLQALLAQYQSAVLVGAWKAARLHAATEGYDLVVQDMGLTPADLDRMAPPTSTRPC